MTKTNEILQDTLHLLEICPAPGHKDVVLKGLAKLSAFAESLELAIIAHRAQKADDRCVEDDDRLYAALGDGVKCDRRVGDKEAMLRNCARFIDRRCEGGGWPSYADLEAALRQMVEAHPGSSFDVGSPGSDARAAQDDQRSAVAGARRLLGLCPAATDDIEVVTNPAEVARVMGTPAFRRTVENIEATKPPTTSERRSP